MNRQPKPLGLDLGFGFTKCIDGDQAVIFQSHMRRHIADPSESAELTEGSFHIELDDGDYIVGDDTLSPSLLEYFARQPDRLIKDYGRNLVLTATAPFSDQENPLHVVVGLPVTYFQQWENALVDRLTGYHKIGVHQPGGRCVRKNIHIRKVHVVPHPLGTFTSLIMDQKGRLRASEYNDKKIALVDVGFRTTDIMVMASGRFCNRGSGTIDIGLANGFEMVARKLYQETDIVPGLNRLYRAIRMGFIRIDDQEYNLEKRCTEMVRHLSSTLADRINYGLKDDWDIERVLLTGGGAADIADELAPRIDGEVILIEHDQDVRLSNAQGQLRLARHMLGASGFCHTG